MPHPYWQTAL